jgi:hypothetical protein
VGYFSPYCGKVIYHGDSEKKKWGNSTEAITFLEIKKTDYLVYINTFVKDIFKIIS